MQVNGYPIVHAPMDTYPLIINEAAPAAQKQEVSCCKEQKVVVHCHQTQKTCQRKVSDDDGSLPISLATAIPLTMFMMASLIAICGYIECSDGTFDCSLQNFPDISHVMGLAPLNKLYSIMLTIYSCTKQAEARAYYNR